MKKLLILFILALLTEGCGNSNLLTDPVTPLPSEEQYELKPTATTLSENKESSPSSLSPTEKIEKEEKSEYLLDDVELFDKNYLENIVRLVMNGTVMRQEPLTESEKGCLNYKVVEITNGEQIDLDGNGIREKITLQKDPEKKETETDWILSVGNCIERIPYYYDLTGRIYAAAIEKKRGSMQLIQLLLPARESLVMDEEAEIFWYAFGKLEYLRNIPCGPYGTEAIVVSGNGELITSDLNSRYVRSYRTVKFRLTHIQEAEFAVPRLAALPLEPIGYSDMVVLKHDLNAYKDRKRQEKVEIKQGSILSLLYDDGENWVYADADGEGIWIEVECPGTVISGEDHYYMTEIFDGLSDAS